MPRKKRGRSQVTRLKGSGNARKSRIRASIISRTTQQHKSARVTPISEIHRAPRPSTLSIEQLEKRSLVFTAHADMMRNRKLTAAQAARNNGITVRDFWKYLPKAFKKDSDGKIRAVADRYTRRLEVPGPDGPVLLKVRGSKAAHEVAQFRNDVFRFLQGDRTALDKWEGRSIQGHDLLTDSRILQILGEQGNLPEHFGSEQVLPYYGVPA